MLSPRHPQAITILLSSSGTPARKTFAVDSEGKLDVSDYPFIKTWQVRTGEASDYPALLGIISKATRVPKACIISGAPRNELSLQDCVVRRYLGETAPFDEVPRSWVAFDIDDMEVPDADDHETLVGYALERFPEPFASASVVYQWTSKQSVQRPRNLLRLRLWFLLSDPVLPSCWRGWARSYAKELHVDPALYNPVQPHYTATPEFIGMADPFADAPRVGYLERGGVADVSELRKHLRPPTSADVVSTEVRGHEAQIQTAIEIILAQVTEGARHHHMLGAACQLVAIGCDDARVLETCEELIIKQGRDPQPNEAENALAYARRCQAAGTLRSAMRPIEETFGDISPPEEDPVPDAPAPTVDEQIDEAWSEIADPGIDPDEDQVGYGSVVYDPEADAAYNALVFARRRLHGGFLHWANCDFEWTGRKWEELESCGTRLDTLVLRIIADTSWSKSKCQEIADVLRGLNSKERLRIGCSIENPREPVPNRFCFNNGMLGLDDFLFDPYAPLTPNHKDIFIQHTLPFSYDPTATCPTWEKHLEDCFLGDDETKRELQKMFGYILSGATNHQKFFVLQGPGRAGKGTVCRVLEQLIGREDIAAKGIKDFGDDYFLADIYNKKLLFVPEANPEGGRRDQGATAANEIKKITGEDIQNVRRKHLNDLPSMLVQARIVMSCNRLPPFIDPSGALFDRMIMLRFRQSFAGREDIDLDKKLARELPGIMNWALEGCRKLTIEDGHFRLPEYSKQFIDAVKSAAAPISSMLREVATPEADGVIPVSELYALYTEWARENNNRVLSRSRFTAEVLEVFPTATLLHRARVGQLRVQVLSGVRYTPGGEACASRHRDFSEEDA